MLRPADGDETVAAWKLALEEHRPVALILSRQNIKTLPVLSQSRRKEAMQISKGGYVVMDAAKPAAIRGRWIGGLDVGRGCPTVGRRGYLGARGECSERGADPRPAALVSEYGTVRRIPRYGMTSGLPINLSGLVGEDGYIHGLDHFGYSAPYKVLDEQFGYNGETVAEEVKELLGKKRNNDRICGIASGGFAVSGKAAAR